MSYDFTWNSELYHHGIKCQKWGVRRYQNEDGSLTAAGRKRYLKPGEYDKVIGTFSNAYHNITESDRDRHKDVERLYSGKGIKGGNEISKGSAKLNNDVENLRKSYQVGQYKPKRKLFESRKKYNEDYSRRNKDFEKVGREYIAAFAMESLDQINRMPKKDRELAQAFWYQEMGYDW